MEEIIQILIFVGAMVIAVIGQNAKNKKKPTTTSPQEVLEDMFPELTLQGEGEAMAPSVPPPAPVRRRKHILQCVLINTDLEISRGIRENGTFTLRNGTILCTEYHIYR